MHPDFFLFENVKGLWQTKRHRAFYEEFKTSLQTAGYKTTERLTNALEFGAPQDRDRILLFGVSENLLNANMCNGNDLLNFQWDAYQLYDLDQVKNGYPWPTTDPFNENVMTNPPADIPVQLTVEHWFRQNNVNNHPNANDYFTPRAGLTRMQTVEEGDVAKKSYKRIHRWRYSPTAAYGNNEVHLHPYMARRMSAAETLAIQTLPADFTLPSDMSLTNKFKTIGNGVPYILASGIAQTINAYLNNNVQPNNNQNQNNNLIDLSNIE
jgi:DNA (cytosine-5)-methyltransferase 1